LNLADKLALLEPGSAPALALAAERSNLDHLQALWVRAGEATANWRDKLSVGDTESALNLARATEQSIMRWLKPAWWRLRGELNRRYNFTKHAVQPSLVKTLETLAAEQDASRALADAKQALATRHGVSDLTLFFASVDTFGGNLATIPVLKKLRNPCLGFARHAAQHPRRGVCYLATRYPREPGGPS
jgi:hypothetical protein